MTLIIVVMALAGMTGLWMVTIAIMPEKVKFMLARHPALFLLIHVPFMMFMTMIGGEGIIFGVANLVAGIVAQCGLAVWGMRKHGLTFWGKPGPRFAALHPRKMDRATARQYRALIEHAMKGGIYNGR